MAVGRHAVMGQRRLVASGIGGAESGRFTLLQEIKPTIHIQSFSELPATWVNSRKPGNDQR